MSSILKINIVYEKTKTVRGLNAQFTMKYVNVSMFWLLYKKVILH